MRAMDLLDDSGMPNRDKENLNSKYYGKAMRTPAFKAAIVEPILICCINGSLSMILSLNAKNNAIINHQSQKVFALSS
jgi:hypothetical protein